MPPEHPQHSTFVDIIGTLAVHLEFRVDFDSFRQILHRRRLLARRHPQFDVPVETARTDERQLRMGLQAINLKFKPKRRY